MYLTTIQPGNITINGYTSLSNLHSSTSTEVEGTGAGIYIDSSGSSLNMLVDGVSFSNILGRTIGGAFYIVSSSFKSTVTI